MAIEIINQKKLVQGIIYKAVTSGKGRQEGFSFFQPLSNCQPPNKITNIYNLKTIVFCGLKMFLKAWV